MIIRKHYSENKSIVPLSVRLNAYHRQVQHVKNSMGNAAFHPFAWKKNTLAALIPLAAAGAANAQCLGSPNGSAALPMNQSFELDIDGNGNNDIRFLYTNPATTFKKWQVTALDPSFFVQFTSMGYAQGKTIGTVTRGQNFETAPLVMADMINNIGNFALAGSTMYLPVRKGDNVTGRPGWVKLFVDANASTFKVLDRGLESATNSSQNSAVIGDCASIAAAVLPVEMTRFNVAVEQKNVRLAWATATEQNNSGYEIQRSTDGKRFAKIGWVEGMGTTNEQQTYYFIDKEVRPNTILYYRLQQLDNDGSATYSPIRSIIVKDDNLFTLSDIFPNPIVNGAQLVMLRVSAPLENEIDIKVFDARGIQMQTFAKLLEKGDNTIEIPVSGLIAGTYFVKIQVGNDVNYKRVTVK